MPIDQIVNLQDGDEVRTILNSVVTQVNTNTTDITTKQPLDADLTAIAALTPSNDDFMQRKSGAWANRTIAQVKTDLAINNVDNTSDVDKPVSTAQAAANTVIYDSLLASSQQIYSASKVYWNVTPDNTSITISLLAQVNALYISQNVAPTTVTLNGAGSTFPIGGSVAFFNNGGAGDMSLTAGGGVTIIYQGTLGSAIVANKGAVLIRVATTIWWRVS